MSISRLEYWQYFFVGQKNYTLTNFADHVESLSHDQINRYLKDEKLTPKLLWEHVQKDIVFSDCGYVLCDDTVADKDFSHSIESVRRQYSGNAHGIVKGIVTCVYVNPETKQFWAIDYRIFDPEIDGKSKLEHVNDMLNNIVYQKNIPFTRVLMDGWYATKYLMLKIEELGKIYYCPLKKPFG